jgi:hypothetical protein
MTHGILIFAQNNNAIDYVKMAIFSAKQAIKHLNLPVSLVTDSEEWLRSNYPDDVEIFDKILPIEWTTTTQSKRFHDGSLASSTYEWKNLSRSSVYDLSPYDKTLVIDSDYIINSNVLADAFKNDHAFQIYQKSVDLAGWRNTSSFTRLNPRSIKFYWATAFVFEKNPVTKSFFDLINFIKDNWKYYRTLYHIETSTFRNDYAFSIAIHIMNGSVDYSDFAVPLPGSMTYTLDRDIFVSMTDNKMKFLVEKKGYRGEYIFAKTTGLDVHVMNKHSLSRFLDGGQGV